MSDKGKRSSDEPQDEGWEPPWSFGVEGEPVDTPAWEFSEAEALTSEDGDHPASDDSDDGTVHEAAASQFPPFPLIVPIIEEARPATEETPKEPQTIESRASRVRKVDPPELDIQCEDPCDLSIGPAPRSMTREERDSISKPEESLLLARNLTQSELESIKKSARQDSESLSEPLNQAAEAVSSPSEPVVDDAAEVVAPVAAKEEKPRIEAVRPDPQAEPSDGELEMMIEFEDVTKRFRNQTVLRDLTFRIPRGQTVCLIGESGCGKTVNLKLMIGLIRPDKGRVSFKGEDLARMNEKKITATRIKFGFLFQMAALFDSMSIYDNVAFGLREHRLVDEKDMPDYIRERLTEVGLPPGVDSKKPAELSGGQRKRVGLARALALKPEVMLYDEPTTGLDPIMTDIINELILQTQADKSRSGIIVTHEMRTVTKCADRVIMLYPISRLEPDEPQILYDGPATGLEDHPDPRVRQFVRGEAGERLRELNPDRLGEDPATGIVPMDPDDIMNARPPR